MNRSIVWVPVAFVLGGLVGAWGPSEELRSFKNRSAETVKAQESRPSEGFDSFAQTLNIPDAAHRGHGRRARPAESAQQPAAVSNDAPAVASTPEAQPREPARPQRRMSPEDLRARIDEAADLWRARMDVVRAQTVDKLGLDANGSAKFDDALANMNGKLRDSIQTIADMLAQEEQMTPELGVRLMGDLCSTLAESYDEIGQCVGEDRRGEVSVLELHNFIDPSVAEPLISVQDKLGGMRFPGMGMGRRR